MKIDGMDKFIQIRSLRPGHQLHMADGRWHTTFNRNIIVKGLWDSQVYFCHTIAILNGYF